MEETACSGHCELTADDVLKVINRLTGEERTAQDQAYALNDGSLRWQFEAIRRAGGRPALFVGPTRYEELKALAPREVDMGRPLGAFGSFGIPVIVRQHLGSLWFLGDETTMRSAWEMDRKEKT